jgi:hypothetical protein
VPPAPHVKIANHEKSGFVNCVSHWMLLRQLTQHHAKNALSAHRVKSVNLVLRVKNASHAPSRLLQR